MISYFIEIFICWFLFFGIYLLFLNKETFYQANRWYLLISLVAGIVIPALQIDVPFWFTSEEYVQEMVGLSSLQISAAEFKDDSETIGLFQISWKSVFIVIYSIGLIFFSSRFLYGLSKIYNLYKKRITKKQLNHFQVIRTSGIHLPFSFFHFVFISHQCPIKADLHKVLTHEWHHIKGWHSVDVLFMELLQIIFWINPMTYLYKKAIKQNHEFIADSGVIREVPLKEYGRVLLSQKANHLQLVLANHFFQSQLKTRIMKMKQKPSTRIALYKYLLVIPVVGLMLVLFSFSNSSHSIEVTTNELSSTIDTLKRPPLPPTPPKPPATEMPKTAPSPPSPPAAPKAPASDGKLKKPVPPTPPPPPKVTELEMEKAYVVIDGKESTMKALIKLDSESIASVDVLKGEAAISKYGNKAKEGAILVSTKKKAKPVSAVNADIMQNEDEIFNVVEDMPNFPGCEMIKETETRNKCANSKLIEFISENLKYPAEARKAGKEGIAIVQFVVNKKGGIENIQLLKDPGSGLGKAAVLAMEEMNTQNVLWIPGKQQGNVIKVQMTLPVKFSLPKNDIK